MNCVLTIDEKVFSYAVEGVIAEGRDEVLFEHYDWTLKNTSWKEDGYQVIDLLNTNQFQCIKDSARDVLRHIVSDVTENDTSNLELIDYHKFVNNEQHQGVLERTRELRYNDLDIDREHISQRVERELGLPVAENNPFLKREILILRISRPQTLDINPPHRDGYLDVWKRTINLWIPIDGCSRKSSLPVMPGSHLMNEMSVTRTEAQKAKIEGRTYQVPAILKTAAGMNFIRPNPNYGEALIFTPFLLHGSSINEQADETRISLELRLPLL
jgi:hypothetical protein